LLPGDTPRLAGESPADNVNCAEFVGGDGSDVVVDGCAGPVLSEDCLAELVSLAEGNCPKRSGSFKSKAKSSYA
tara:strand:- start:1327 stop:1548 length:222 start_codon:yes stop_codon:yes gene_type:complete